MDSCSSRNGTGFRAIVFRTADSVYIQSRDLRPLDRYFPELHDALIAQLPPQCIVDGEIVIVTANGDDQSRADALAAGASAFVAKQNLLELPALLSRGGSA